MGYSKSSSETRGKMRWRAYVNVKSKQIVHYCRTQEEARKWSNKMNERFKEEKKMEDGIDTIKELLGLAKKRNQYVILHNCAIKFNDTSTRCEKASVCVHYGDCLSACLREGWNGWTAREL